MGVGGGLSYIKKYPYYLFMFHKVFRVSLLSLLLSLLPSNIYSANSAEDFLLRVDTNQGTTPDSSQAVPNIAKLKQMGFRVPASNPDNLKVQIVLANPLNNPNDILDSKWNIGTWIYGPSLYCLNDDTCSFILVVRPNYNQQAQIKIYKKADDKDGVISDCPATYTVEKNENKDSVISYNLSITCLNIKATFASYTFSGYDIGFTDVPYQYTVPSYVINTDYFELAKQSYDRNGGKQGLNKPTSSAEKESEICVTASNKAGDYADEQCTEGNKWAFQFCDLKPKMDLQVLRNKKWVKIRTINGVKSIDDCPDDEKYTGYYFFKFDGTMTGKHRIKTYGSKKFSTGYIDLVIARNDAV
jgi:hypothetical protein